MLVMLALAMASAPGKAADTAKERYNNDMTCSAIVSTAVEQHAHPANMTSDQASALSAIYAKRTAASGTEAGVPAAKATSDTARLKRTIVKRLRSSDAAKAASEEAETAKMTTNCAALFGFSLMGQNKLEQ